MRYQRYNNAVLAVTPQPQPDGQAQRPGRHYIFELAAAGPLIIAALIVILRLVRDWHYRAWSAR
jgi:hypothetical protein